MNSANSSAQSFSDETDAYITADVSVRPKVMRRPVSFSGAAANNPLPQIHLPPTLPTDGQANENLALMVTEPAPMQTVPAKSWQDDWHFGITLLGVVVVVNLAMMGWLSLLRTAPESAPPPRNIAAPLSPPATAKPLTFYAKPAPRAAVPKAYTPNVFAPLGGADSGPEQ